MEQRERESAVAPPAVTSASSSHQLSPSMVEATTATSSLTDTATTTTTTTTHPDGNACDIAADTEEGRRRRQSCQVFQELVQHVQEDKPVAFSTFQRQDSTNGHRVVNVDLLEAYFEYARSISHEPEIQMPDSVEPLTEEPNALPEGMPSVLPILERGRLSAPVHWWNQFIGERFSRRRGCLQFWVWITLGLIVSAVFAFFLAHLAKDEVLHLDAFTDDDVYIERNYAYLSMREEVSFHLTYDFVAAPPLTQAAEFRVYLMEEDDLENYQDGEWFHYIEKGSTNRTTNASLPLTYIENENKEDLYLIIQPCFLNGNFTVDYCQDNQLPAPVGSKHGHGTRIFKLRDPETIQRVDKHPPRGLHLASYSVNPKPDCCQASGWVGVAHLLIFTPYFIAVLFGLRLCQMAFHCESFRANLERQYFKECDIPEEEVDYWQPNPWDRKVPKTRLLGPCCWKKMRRPYEPFYTWWRHENYFTWIFFPYRNERLSRGERGLIIFCSLYITFYVTFAIVMMHSTLDRHLSVAASVVVYSLLITLCPTLGKAIFKEMFKLIFRQRRKFFRLKATGKDTSKFSFRLAFWMQVAVVILLTIGQGPLLYIWLRRSCMFFRRFMYFGVLASIFRISIIGLLEDYAWYVIIKAWGWRDLCPNCTERLVHCDCFNDELLVLAVDRVGPKWELIIMLDSVMSRTNKHQPQFSDYTPEQLRERWDILVDRAEKHIAKMETLEAYRAKKELDRQRRQQRLSFLPGMHGSSIDPTQDVVIDVEEPKKTERCSCSLERKVLVLNSKIKLDKFEKHYDSTITDIFSHLQDALLRHHSSDDTRPRDDSDGDLRVYSTPEQRLERREAEYQLRERVFAVLKNVSIEEHDEDVDEETPLTKLPTEPQLSPRSGDPRGKPLLSRRSTKTLLTRRNTLSLSKASEDDLVVVVTDTPVNTAEELLASYSSRRNAPALQRMLSTDSVTAPDLMRVFSTDSNVMLSGVSEYDDAPLSTDHLGSTSSATLRQKKTYAVVEKRPTLMRRLSTTVSTATVKAFKLDTNDEPK
ncbi:TPA: hypothetical protein N0F65_010242 [Lagenidium giganteum]|uniref:Uncharacterized protein n=1 Tax=Lagenidium giganteum TaxID=4803 RepID=A0AAV2Z189_9STRA|nr:TPA: hypothetical protein N0F65_010242 [Lagenidium giganteum]